MSHPKTQGQDLDFGFKPPILGLTVKETKLDSRTHLTPEENLPESFRYTPEQLTINRDQGKCGSCWAFAITSVIADIIKIKHGISVALSPQNLLNCYGNTCDGADIDDALHSIPKNAFVPEVDSPYTQYDANINKGKCISGSSGYYININNVSSYRIEGKGKELIRNMKAHIYHDGPIIGTMLETYPDFMKYDGVSIYEPKPNQPSHGGHAIEIIGWGKNNDGIEYWICRNSWNPVWPASHIPGEGIGWFYVKMGVNASRIEESAYACIPEIHGEAKSITPDDEYTQDSIKDEGKNSINPYYSPPVITNKSNNFVLFFAIFMIFILFYIILTLGLSKNN